ncbi:LIC_12071 family protein [Leptospira interrogans]|uniref:LIC_12071 family protein n=1 Tax=Leptospira interrogans TaxID=173 RepID=UPI004036897D
MRILFYSQEKAYFLPIGWIVKIFKSIFYFLLLLIVCESIALGIVAWSFLESSLASFELLKIGSDNRARDTLSALTKAAENSGVNGSYEDMNFVFSRFVKVSEKDADGYTIKEIFLTNEEGIVLAHSNPEYLVENLKKRKPISLYQDSLYTRAFHLRKWQISIPVLLNQKKDFLSKSFFFSKFEKFFPEINEPEILLSAAVYHPVKLERAAAIHMIYDRGNFRKFVFQQTELLEWLLRNDSLIALGAALFLEFVYLLLTLVSSKNDRSKPFVERISHSQEVHVPVLAKHSSPLSSVIFPGSLGNAEQNQSIQTEPVLSSSDSQVDLQTESQTQPSEPTPVAIEAVQKTETTESKTETNLSQITIKTEPVVSQIDLTSKEEVLDAIYLG